MLTHDTLKGLLAYDPETGDFTWLMPVSRRVHTGMIAGNLDKDGYTVIQIGGQKYRAGRLAFFYMIGEWPENEIDHIDRDKGNDAWINLREATRGENVQNREYLVGEAGFRGVRQVRDRFQARISIDGVRECLGMFDSAEEANRAYLEHEGKFYGNFSEAKEA